jgi:hypothetical protein
VRYLLGDNWVIDLQDIIQAILTTIGKEKMKVAVLGPLGTYTHDASHVFSRIGTDGMSYFSQAALKAFGSQVIYEERKTITSEKS